MKQTLTSTKPNLSWRFAALFGAVVSLSSLLGTAHAQITDNRAPDVPQQLDVDIDEKVHFHAYAIGDQIYAWVVNPTNAALGSWNLVAPDATLYDADGNIVGTHSAGPTWISNSGSMVKGRRKQGLTMDESAIQWLLLDATVSEGPGIFADISSIQRVHTVAGLPPRTPGAPGDIVRSPYYAEYFFYRRTK